jgi:hypothetical protein
VSLFDRITWSVNIVRIIQTIFCTYSGSQFI